MKPTPNPIAIEKFKIFLFSRKSTVRTSGLRSQLQIFDSNKLPAPQLQSHIIKQYSYRKFSGLVDFSGNYHQFSAPIQREKSQLSSKWHVLNGYEVTILPNQLIYRHRVTNHCLSCRKVLWTSSVMRLLIPIEHDVSSWWFLKNAISHG
jgi:hypothetical protein